MVVFIVVEGNSGGYPGGGGDVPPPLLKQYIQMYCDSSDIGAVSGIIAVTRSAVGQEMVVASRFVLVGNIARSKGGGGKGRGVDGRVRRSRRDKGLSCRG